MLGVLFLLALMGITAAATSVIWHVEQQREREAELLYIGSEYLRAIGAYYDASPGRAKEYPKRLEELIRDPRYPDTRRYMRKLYADPMTGSGDWGLLKLADGGIAGVYSRSEKAPIKRANFTTGARSFEKAKRYSDWIFAYGPGAAAAASEPAGSSAAGGTQSESSTVASNSPAPAPAPVPASPPRALPENECASIATNDKLACAAAAKRYGEEMGLACMATSPARIAACMRGRSVPALVTKP
jgi:pyruvate/2-oxoglutarate dehydrogenase complex dihydrolipoamide acyltransferase (E2) component